MADQQVSNSGGVGFFGLLTLIFVAAKVTGHLDWSWFWVFSPIFFSFGLIVLFILSIIVITIIKELNK